MTTDKSQPTGWVVVDFDDDVATFRDSRNWQAKQWPIRPFASLDAAENHRTYLHHRKGCEVHPWPLPASVIARLKERHPTVDWSQVPVADEPKPGRWVMEHIGASDEPYRDQTGWKDTAAECSAPWATKAAVEGYMWVEDWDFDRFRPVNLDDLPASAVAEPSEVEKLRAEVERLTRERDDVRASADFLRRSVGECHLMISRDSSDLQTEYKWDLGDLPLRLQKVMRERDKLRVELAAAADTVRDWRQAAEFARKQKEAFDEELSRCKQAHSAAEDDVESLREQFETMSRHADQQRLQIEQLGKTTLSRRDEFAKAALTGTLANSNGEWLSLDRAAKWVVDFADATIRALDGAGGA